jgi:RNA polymerase sigma factor (sigma-70 family)
VEGHETDAILIGRIIVGDADAARVLVERHTVTLRRLLSRAGARAGDIDDLLQEIWIRVIRSAGRYDPLQPFPRWLFAIAMNRLRTRWARRDSEEPLDAAAEITSAEPAADAALASRQRADALRAEIMRLPPHLADAILLRFFEELSEKEMAVELGIPPGTVKSRLHNAMKKLRDSLEAVLYA